MGAERGIVGYFPGETMTDSGPRLIEYDELLAVCSLSAVSVSLLMASALSSPDFRADVVGETVKEIVDILWKDLKKP